MNEVRAMACRDPVAYVMIGDLDKPFHRPECECEDCEEWRTRMDRPTHAELRNRKDGAP